MDLVEMQAECLDMSERWFPDVAHSLAHHCLALAGEVGELCNLVKKVERGSLPLTEEVMVELAMETTDVLIYVLNIGAVLNVDLDTLYRLKQDYNEERFGAGSSNNASRDVRTNTNDKVSDDTSAFVPVSKLSQPL